ncbi:hypothetical protein RCL1_005727 [Eukaryota sp. TZLM3-RCL]
MVIFVTPNDLSNLSLFQFSFLENSYTFSFSDNSVFLVSKFFSKDLGSFFDLSTSHCYANGCLSVLTKFNPFIFLLAHPSINSFCLTDLKLPEHVISLLRICPFLIYNQDGNVSVDYNKAKEFVGSLKNTFAEQQVSDGYMNEILSTFIPKQFLS